jgi:peptidoglycan/LPS O-acetylase OafA/YrhL
MKSFEQVLVKNKGLGPGFDFLRVFLATTIVAFHAQRLIPSSAHVLETPLWFIEYALVPMFFALSGFLVSASGMRLSLRNFLINRGLRIVPALAVDVLLCTLVIGPIFTTVPLKDYFSSSEFRSYFLNIFGYVHYLLPGLFENNINSQVNGALWTVPYEIICYGIISFFIIFKFLHDPKRVLFCILLMYFLGMFFEYSGTLPRFPGMVEHVMSDVLIARQSQIVMAFLFGVLAFQLKDNIPYDRRIFFVSLIICLASALLFDASETYHVRTRIILMPIITYITVFIGLTKIGIPKYFKKGDYSYGIYLYHVPLLQIIISLLPLLAGLGFLGGFAIFLIGIPFIVLLAALSWHFVEKPILALRKRFSFVATVRDV